MTNTKIKPGRPTLATKQIKLGISISPAIYDWLNTLARIKKEKRSKVIQEILANEKAKSDSDKKD